MRPAICTSFEYTIPFPEALRMIRAAGFDVVSLGARPEHSGYATTAGRAAIRKLLDQHGFTLDSVHAPFPEGDRLFSLVEAERAESVRLCKIAIDAAAELTGHIVVIHLIQPYGIPHDEKRTRMLAEGRRSVATLAAYAGDCGVKLALENGQKADYDKVLADLLAEFTQPQVGFCYDSGHENVRRADFSVLKQFGHRLLTVHIHDNKGSDSHVLPYEGDIDWAKFRRIFSGLGYAGNLLLETDIRNSQFKDPSVFLARAWECAQKLCLENRR